MECRMLLIPQTRCVENTSALRALYILWHKLLLRTYVGNRKKWIGTEMNDLELRLEVVSRSCQPLRDIRH